MATIKLITHNEDHTYDFRCPYPSGCGVPGGESFSSTGWGNREDAVARAEQHLAEHQDRTPMQEVEEFRAERGLSARTAGQVSPEDWEL